MKMRVLAIILLAALMGVSGRAEAEKKPSPAEQKMQWAQQAIAKNAESYQAHNQLAMALGLRARETSDTRYYAKAEEALAESFRIAPDNFEGKKVQVWVLLGQHEFTRALAEAQALNRRAPDDVLVYGFLADANAELGNYAEAEQAAQWMLDLRPGNVPGLTRGAYLRELFGDIEGALEFMSMALQRTAPAESEDRAWILTQMAHLELMRGQVSSAEKLLERALKVFPAYHYALGTLARAKTAQQDFEGGVRLQRQRYQSAPHPENLFDVARALERAGRGEEATAAYLEFELKARAEMEKADNANRELIFYYAYHSRQPLEALRIARLEAGRRHDVYTLDAYAWALHRSGENEEARRQIEKALAVGIRDAMLFYHAGAIATALGDTESARGYLQESLDLNPASEWSAAAAEALAALASASPRAGRPAAAGTL